MICTWFKVALRIRPLNDAEIEEGATTVAHKIDSEVRKKNTKTIETCPELLMIPLWNNDLIYDSWFTKI